MKTNRNKSFSFNSKIQRLHRAYQHSVNELSTEYESAVLRELGLIPDGYVAVVDDSGCLVRLGGDGAVYRVLGLSREYPNCFLLRGVGSPYNIEIFRKATKKEIAEYEKKNEVKS